MSSQPSDGTVTLGRRSLHSLRNALERTLGTQSATVLQEAGFASGEALSQALGEWLRDRYGVGRAQELDAAFLAEALSGFFTDMGWGALELSSLSESVLLVESADWAESAPGHAPYPSCHLSSGVMADVFSRLAGGADGGAQFAAMEVECRSRGDERCRFLLASPETLTVAYERMTHGMSYRQALGLG